MFSSRCMLTRILISSVSPIAYLTLAGLFGPTFLLSGCFVHHVVLLSRNHLLLEQVWKDQNGFPVGPVWQTAMLSLVPLHLKGNVWKVQFVKKLCVKNWKSNHIPTLY